MRHYTIKRLATLAGVSVRTLHHYDRLGLLKPSVRTEARYRLYGEPELLRLQQILFYRELDFPLAEIRSILDDPEFDIVAALESHRKALEARSRRLSALLGTIDKTLGKLKGEGTMMTDDELYEGFPKEQARAYRQEAVEKFGAEAVESSENNLRAMGKDGFAALKAESEDIARTMAGMTHLDPTSDEVQHQVARHYRTIQLYWGEALCRERNMAEAYSGLARLYVDDPRYTMRDGKENPEYAHFLSRAMIHFAETRLK